MASADFDSSLNMDEAFETIFRWDVNWTSVFVRPMTSKPGLIHFRITLIDGSHFFLWKNREGTWEEWTGSTERARTIGSAIDTHYSCNTSYLA